jgi:sugar (pentulose or hexulose) kinase
VPLYTPVGDQQCALAGVGLREQELSLNVATGSQVSLRAKEYRAGPFQVRPYFDGEFLLTVTHIPAGRSLNALVNLFSELAPESKSNAWEKIIEKLESIPTTTACADLSFFLGAFGGEGALTQLREENLTVGDLMLAALESMARNYRQAAEQISPQKNWRGIVLSGGLAQKIRRLQVLIRRELPGPLRLPNFPEDTLLGLLILGTSWSGQYGTLQENQERILGQTESSPG